MYDKIIFIGDLLRYQNNSNRFADTGLICEYYLLKKQIEQATKLEVYVITYKDSDKFDVKKFYDLCGYETTTDNWIKLVSGEYTEAAKEYFKSCFKNCIVISQVAGAFKTLMDDLNIPYIDIYVSAIKFCPDILLSFRSNINEVTQILKKYVIPEEKFYIEANLIKAYYYRRMIDLEIEPNSLLLCGQTDIDLALIKDKKIVEFLDYRDKIDELISQYSYVYYKPHPYASIENVNEKYIRTLPNVKLINENIYKILCSDNIKAVAALSSGTLIEAKYFGKISHVISHEFVKYWNQYKPITPDEFILIDKICLSPKFWSDVLSPLVSTQECLDLNIACYPNALRRNFNTWWGYEFGLHKDIADINLSIQNNIVNTNLAIQKVQTDLINKIEYQMKPISILKKLISLVVPIKRLKKKLRGDKC